MADQVAKFKLDLDFRKLNVNINDRVPERADEVNTVLRGAGLVVRALHASSADQARKLISKEAPFLVLFSSKSLACLNRAREMVSLKLWPTC